MSIPFSQTLRSLEADTAHSRLIGLIVIGLLLAVWLVWGLFSRVTLYEVSPQARLTGASTALAQFSPAVKGAFSPVSRPGCGWIAILGCNMALFRRWYRPCPAPRVMAGWRCGSIFQIRRLNRSTSIMV